jgi:hypothetical protein
MAEDDKKSFWGSLPGILTGLAAVMTAAGALIYHGHSKSKPKPAPTQQQSSTQAASGSIPSQAPTALPEGFAEQASYTGDCASLPAGAMCIHFVDGYQWLVQDKIEKHHNELGRWQNHRIMEAKGKRGRYQHILDTQYIKLAAE